MSRAAVRTPRTRTKALKQARESFLKRAWGSAFSQLSTADRQAPLDAEDLVLFAQAAMLTGREAEGTALLARSHQNFMSRGNSSLAARCAFWLGFTLLLSGESAKAGGWFSRAQRLLNGQPDCVENGYMLLPEGYRSFHSGDAATAVSMFVKAAAIGERFRDKDLLALALQGQGRSLIRQGETHRGMALLDEAMVAVTAGEVSPLNAGGIYCSVLEACSEIFDFRRAQEWTSALEKWCESQPDLVPYRGHCLVRRAELLQLHGAWADALEAAHRATELLSHPPPKPDVGSAFYQLGEIQRLRGKFAESEEAYFQASQWNLSPRPGLAQLRLAQGRVDAAKALIRRVVEEVREPIRRARIPEAFVDIVLASDDVTAARGAAEELAEIAGKHDFSFLQALSFRASGTVLLAANAGMEAL